MHVLYCLPAVSKTIEKTHIRDWNGNTVSSFVQQQSSNYNEETSNATMEEVISISPEICN